MILPGAFSTSDEKAVVPPCPSLMWEMGDAFPGEFLPCFQADREKAERASSWVCCSSAPAAQNVLLQTGRF